MPNCLCRDIIPCLQHIHRTPRLLNTLLILSTITTPPPRRPRRRSLPCPLAYLHSMTWSRLPLLVMILSSASRANHLCHPRLVARAAAVLSLPTAEGVILSQANPRAPSAATSALPAEKHSPPLVMLHVITEYTLARRIFGVLNQDARSDSLVKTIACRNLLI